MTVSDSENKSVFNRAKDNFSYAKQVVASVPVYKRPLLPIAILVGTIGEAFYALRGTLEANKLTARIKDKYRIDEVKLDAPGCQADIGNVFQSQLLVMSVEGKDYVFLLTWDTETNEPYLSSAPVLDKSLPYQPYPENPETLVK